ncbi:quinon protein alcohol dehydrogenase-like superfamily [Tribonema minus]|uniref:Quinon protein alcohol dehydrogenase-like superfamily n=1 Tax=Tribonema minus TaxID=303371 RepID=A0A835ZFE1_9STRA|nr:quinon protein alcohol dehydrogenase-like superfamily [Tribonema minus]
MTGAAVIASPSPTSSAAAVSTHAPVALRLAWSLPLGKCVDATPLVLADPAVAGAQCLCGGAAAGALVVIGSHSGQVKAASLDTGEEVWAQHFGCRVESSPAASADGSLVYIGCHDGWLRALHTADGSLAWSFDTGDIIKCSPTSATFAANTPVLLVGSHAKTLSCLAQSTGALVWQWDPGGHIFASPAHVPSAALVFVATTAGVVASLTEGGELRWRHNAPAPVFADPAVANSGSALVVACVSGTVLGLACSSGVQLWQLKLNSAIFSSPCVANHTVHAGSEVVAFGDHSGCITCVRVACGTVIWHQSVDRNRATTAYASPFACSCKGLTVFCVATSCGMLAVLEQVSGAVVSRALAPGQVFSSPVMVGDQLLIGCRNDHLLCYKVAVGRD